MLHVTVTSSQSAPEEGQERALRAGRDGEAALPGEGAAGARREVRFMPGYELERDQPSRK